MRKFASIAAVTGLLACAGSSMAQGLIVEYSVSDAGGGLYAYKFACFPDSGWAPGMGWRWFIFGDEPCTACFPPGTGFSPIADFAMTSSFPVGPWTALSSSSGGHNGPTFSGVLDYWIPASGSETLTWTGTSATCVDNTALLMRFSTLAGTLGGALAADWSTATLVGGGCGGGGCDCVCNYDTSTGGDVCDFFDFINFQDLFAAGDPCGCDLDTSTGSGVCDFFDFINFQDLFSVGC